MSRRTGQAWKHRPHHRAFYRLSASSRQTAIDGFRANAPTTAIVALIAKTHGETIPVSSLNRYREWWNTVERPVVEAAVKTEELLKAFKDHPTPGLERLISQLLQAQRLTAMAEDTRPDPNELGWLDVEERKLRLKEREVALRERALEQKVNRAAGNVERALKKKGIDAETMAQIRQEIYGIPA
jgi:hypothetical protein